MVSTPCARRAVGPARRVWLMLGSTACVVRLLWMKFSDQNWQATQSCIPRVFSSRVGCRFGRRRSETFIKSQDWDESMSDRKYRQRGYQDDSSERLNPERKRQSPAGGAPRSVVNRQHRKPNVPGFQDVIRCARCGQTWRRDIGVGTTCSSCGTALHTCAQCVSFDGDSRFECRQPIDARITPKDERNSCSYFAPQVTVERQTHSQTGGSRSSRQAFDDLFK